MAEFKRQKNRETLRLRFNVNKLIQESGNVELGGAEWHFKAERRVNEPPGAAAGAANGMGPVGFGIGLNVGDVGNEELQWLDLPPVPQRGRAFRHVLRVTIFRKRLLSDVPAVVDYEICLKGSKNDMRVKGVHTFEGEEEVQSFSSESFMPWAQLLFPGNGFMDNNSVLTIFVDIRLRDSTDQMNAKNALLFSSSTPFPAADGVLLIEGKRAHVSKALLAIHSPVFKQMFEKSADNEVEIADLEYFTFLELLTVIYPTLHPIIDANVEYPLALADRFKMVTTVVDCEKFLIFDSALPLGKKLLLAQKFRLEKLKKSCVRQCLSYDDVKNLGVEYHMLHSDIKCLLLENITAAAKLKNKGKKPKSDTSSRSLSYVM